MPGKVITSAIRAEIFTMRQSGATIPETMAAFGVSDKTVERYGGKTGRRTRGRTRESVANHHDHERPVCFVSRCGKKPAKNSKFCEMHKTPALRSREPLARLMAGR